MREDALFRAIGARADAAKAKRLTLHDQRHTFAVNTLREGYEPDGCGVAAPPPGRELLWTRYRRHVSGDRDYAMPEGMAEEYAKAAGA